MALFFYLLSSLPSLIRNSDPPITLDELREQCAPHLSEAQLAVLDATCLIPPDADTSELPVGSLSDRYAIWETALRNALLPARSRKQDTSHYRRLDRDAFSETASLAAAAAGAHNPLEAETKLDDARFQTIENLESGVMFTFDALCAYKLKLMLLEKYRSRTVERGEKHIDDILHALQAEKSASDANV